MSGKTILYSHWRSSCSWRVRIALKFKQISYDLIPLTSVRKNGDDEFKKINPMEHVPALYIDGVTLIESLSIFQYLEETRPQRPLLPSDPVQRARVREICDVIASGIQPLQNHEVLVLVGEEKQIEWAQRWIIKGFHALEKLLSMSAGKYCVGDAITYADCCLIPQIYNARRYHVDLSHFPIVLRLGKELETHPCFKDTHPSKQPDCPGQNIE